ncbi:hypothetical protein N7509_010304 [Penicillium cosmopolitanum]|uniref:NB-ARC domain-containing protein n=1 Tax=Penicillium cosmopolitanum TaxID=1131564 RepID=A0A9W9VR28_9EURO|nr:uncharacterized protein N7509_010304 [Penicillium cosmopolitanum]KAJ5387763.1 hypothetical protein N7509_010304 [Penicillium cosmopolitanum]
MTGVGKSQTTLEFAYRSRHVFHYIFWIRAEDDAVISQEYSKLIGILGIAPADDPDAKAERVRQWLCTTQGWLIIFDNVESSDLLNMFWPACGHGSVLVTTQNSTLVHRAHAEVELKPFTEDEGSGLLLNYMKELEEGKYISTGYGKGDIQTGLWSTLASFWACRSSS